MKLLGIVLVLLSPLLSPTVTAQAQPEIDDMDAGTQAVRLREMSNRVDALRRDVVGSQIALTLLQESMSGESGYARARITHQSAMGPFFELESMTYALDASPILRRVDATGALDDLGVFDVYSGGLMPGEHVLSVRLDYVGDGQGVFPYMRGYRFTLRGSHTFTAPSNRNVRIQVRAVQRGGPMTPITERPTLEFRELLE